MLNTTTKLFAGASLLFAMNSFAGPLDNGTETCGVPVCNVSETVAALSDVDGNKRGMYALSLMEQYKNSKNLEVLQNLYQAGVELRELYATMQDDSWVWRSANDLVSTSLLSLAKYSTVNGDKFSEYYKLLDGQGSRYSMISYWAGQLETIEDVATLEELVKFAAVAREHSVEQEDESWVPRAASEFLSNITIKLTNLDPAHEGVYTVSVSEEALANGIFPFDKVTVLDSSSSKNLVVSFINSKFKKVVYSYSNAEMHGNTIIGKVQNNGSLANQFELTFDRTTRVVSGTIKTTNTVDINFAGEQTYSTSQNFHGVVPYNVSSDQVIGTMNGSLAGLQGTLAVKSFSKNVYSATFTSDSGAIILHFQGKYFSQNGVLSLTSNNSVKLTLSFRSTDTGSAWVGNTFSTRGGKVTEAYFTAK